MSRIRGWDGFYNDPQDKVIVKVHANGMPECIFERTNGYIWEPSEWYRYHGDCMWQGQYHQTPDIVFEDPLEDLDPVGMAQGQIHRLVRPPA